MTCYRVTPPRRQHFAPARIGLDLHATGRGAERLARRGGDVEQHGLPELRFQERHGVHGVPQSAGHQQCLRLRRLAQDLSPQIERELVVLRRSE
jgi:hypothetical protein